MLCISVLAFASHGNAGDGDEGEYSLAALSDSVNIAAADTNAIFVADSTAIATPDSTQNPHRSDSIRTASLDSIPVDTVKPKSRIRREKVDIDNVITINSSDSLILIGRNIAYMYGNGKVTYDDLKLEAAQIEVDMKDKTVYAFGRPDSVGELQGTPVFEQGGSAYETKTMSYNFKTERAFITDVITQQGEGYLTGGYTKKTADDYYYMKNGRYTTCDHHDNPHFYFQLTTAKVKPKSNVVTGPAYLVLAGLPLPIAVPFGYFPFSEKYSSGVILQHKFLGIILALVAY